MAGNRRPANRFDTGTQTTADAGAKIGE